MAKKKRGAPTKKCPKCGKVQHARVASCKSAKCSHVFVPKKTVKVKKKAVKKAMVARTATTKKGKRRGRPPGVAAASGGSGGGGGFSIADIQAAKSLAAKVGGSSKAKSLLDALG